ncbi:transaldolase [Streptomyces sp. NRRL F-4707]|uniref:transaldolase n=1 Tax=Streptomyces TaxID=1883 RepID=UPI0004BF9BAB|nr:MULTISPECIES: transaldolase [Streptomyces]KOT94631.1 transaldolase [Streptomyces sp. NRRL F-4711]KOX28115.1 transaldolase [Streptomyces sp. NRRL F-4707]KOX43881.1 transaldolase [Streptomyces sp. NRRL F-7442]
MITVTEATATAGALRRLADQGVSVWLDDLSRRRIESGNLAELIRTKNVVGVTTNPSIFQAAIGSTASGSPRSSAAGSGGEYEEQLADLATRGVTADEAVRMMTTADVRAAADVLRGVYDATGGRDGRVSIEVDPRLAHDTRATVAEAKQLAWLVDRPNVMIKIPATKAGLPAITEVVGAGISVNVTLIFSLERYREVMDAYLAGLETARAAGLDLAGVHSVASFFVSRVDSEIDKRLTLLGTDEALGLRGKAALANARLAYEAYENVFAGDRFTALAGAGANPQRPLWASTGVKDPAFRDTLYVEELVAPGTVNTMPEATLDATADHGEVRGDTVTGGYAQARADLAAVERLGVSYDEVVEQLEREGVAKFEAAWDDLLAAVTKSLDSKGVDGE